MLRVIAFSIIILLYGLLSYWIGLRMWQLVGRFIPYLPIALLFWLMFWLIALSFFTGHLSEKYLALGISRWLILVGDYWLAFTFYCLIVLAILELFLFAGQRLASLSLGKVRPISRCPRAWLGCNINCFGNTWLLMVEC